MGLVTNWNKRDIHRKVEMLAQSLYGATDGVSSTALGFGAGTTADPMDFGTVTGKRWIDIRSTCAAVSGSSYAGYFSHKITGAAGSGSGLRGYGYAYGAAATAVYGGEFTSEIHSSASSALTGLGAGIRGVMSIQGDNSGTNTCLDMYYDVASGKDATAGGSSSFMRCSSGGSGTGCNTFLQIGTAAGTQSATALVSTVKTAATNWSHGLRSKLSDGTPVWFMLTTTTPAA